MPAATRWVTGWAGLLFFAVLDVGLRTVRPSAGTTAGTAIGNEVPVLTVISKSFVVSVAFGGTSPGVKKVAVEGRGYTATSFLLPEDGPITVIIPRHSDPNGATVS